MYRPSCSLGTFWIERNKRLNILLSSAAKHKTTWRWRNYQDTKTAVSCSSVGGTGNTPLLCPTSKVKVRTRRRLFHKGKVVNSQCVDSRTYLWELTSHPLYVFEFSGTSEFETNPCLFTENNYCLFTGVDHCLLEKNNCLVTEKIMVWFLEQIIACLLESWRSFTQEDHRPSVN